VALTLGRLDAAIDAAIEAHAAELRGVIRVRVSERLEAVVRQRWRALLAAICIPVVFTFAACGDDASPSVTVAPTTVAPTTGDAVGLTADVYDELMRAADAMTASFTDSAAAQATCAGVAQGVGIAECRRQIDAATATALAASDAFMLSPFSNAGYLEEGPCHSALGDFRFAEHAYLQALHEWAADAALNNPAGDTFNAITRIRGTQLPAAKDELASACRPAPG
jgi:hypothetical protein